MGDDDDDLKQDNVESKDAKIRLWQQQDMGLSQMNKLLGKLLKIPVFADFLFHPFRFIRVLILS